MIFCDTHTHLYVEEFDEDRFEVIRQAVEAGVERFLMPNIDKGSVRDMLDLSAAFPDRCKPMMGLHPTSVNEQYTEELELVEEYLNAPEYCFCAVGEIGIDLYWDQTFRTQQEDAFSRQLDLAVRHDLPVVIHTRNAFDIAAGIVGSKHASSLRGVFHCFGGDIAQAKQAIALGFMIGIGGVITYKNSGLQQVVEAIGMEHLLLETDSPYLPPVPHRGQRNESKYLPLIAARIAGIKKISVEEVAETTTANAKRLFNLSPCRK